MSNFHKIKIIKSKYDEEKDLIIWDVLFVDSGVEQKFCWPSVDLCSCLGIKADKITKEALDVFCEKIEGKTINMQIDGVPHYEPPSPSQKELDTISEGVSEHFDTFRKIVE